MAMFCIGFVAFAGVGLKLINSERTLDRINSLTNTDRLDQSVVMRQLAWDAGYEMSQEKPSLGWGAGGFRFLFPRYQMSRPEIVWQDPRRQQRFMFWEHAHNDYLQGLIETGRIGVGIIGVGALFAVVGFLRNHGRRNLAAMTLAHAALDFPLQNPAILTSWMTVMVLSLRLAANEGFHRPTS